MKAYAAIAVVVMASGSLAQVRSAESYREEIHAELRRLHGVEELRADALREAIARAKPILETRLQPAFEEGGSYYSMMWDPVRYPEKELGPRAAALLRDLVSRLDDAGVFGLLDDAAAAPSPVDGEFWPAITDEDQMRDPTLTVIQLANSALGAMRLANLDGDDARRIAMCRRALTLMRALDANASCMGRTMAHAIASQTCKEVRCELGDRAQDGQGLRSLLEQLDSIEFLPLDEVLRLDAIWQVAVCDDGSFSKKEFAGIQSAMAALPREADALLKLHPDARPRSFFGDDLEEGSAEEAIAHARSLTMRIAQSDDGARAEIDATRIAIALELHRLEHGVYPETLDPLAPLLGGEVPRDAWSWAPFDCEVIDKDTVGGYRLRTTREPVWEFGILREPFDADAGAED